MSPTSYPCSTPRYMGAFQRSYSITHPADKVKTFLKNLSFYFLSKNVHIRQYTLLFLLKIGIMVALRIRSVQDMSKLYFKFGAMASSKTANALMTRFNYEEKGNRVWLIKPDLDNRDDYVNEQGKKITVVKSSVGLMAEAEAISQTEDLLARFKGMRENAPVDVIICDECQFLAPEQVDQLKHVAEYLDTPVLCFGLRSDFQTKLFPGSMRLFEIADSITEVKSVCRCGKKATVNARLNDQGEVIVEGEQVCIGGNDRYEAMCWGCWQDKIKK